MIVNIFTFKVFSTKTKPFPMAYQGWSGPSSNKIDISSYAAFDSLLFII